MTKKLAEYIIYEKVHKKLAWSIRPRPNINNFLIILFLNYFHKKHQVQLRKEMPHLRYILVPSLSLGTWSFILAICWCLNYLKSLKFHIKRSENKQTVNKGNEKHFGTFVKS